jgi:hypothetical protein
LSKVYGATDGCALHFDWGARKTFREAERVYERFQRADRIAMAEGYHGHQYSDENQEAALDFLDRFNGMPLRHGLLGAKELPNKELLCIRSGQVMLDESDARSLMDVIRNYYMEHQRPAQRSLAAQYRESNASDIGTWSTSELNGAPVAEKQITWEPVGSTTVGHFRIDKIRPAA